MPAIKRTYKRNSSIAKKWEKFAIETLNADYENWPEDESIPEYEDHCKRFGQVMERLVAKKPVNSNLWYSTTPSGTEDRTWVRSFMFLVGNKDYSAMLTGFDQDHARHCVKELLKNKNTFFELFPRNRP
jgi:hypothetical protein